MQILHYAIQPKLSPLGERAISLYKKACARYLELDIKEGEIFDEKDVETLQQDLIAQIRTYEESVVFHVFSKSHASLSGQDLQDKVLKLKRIG